VYELKEILAGMIVFQLAEAREVLLGYQRMLDEEFPDVLGVDLAMVNFPGVGKVLVFLFTWTSVDLETGKEFLRKFHSLGNVAMDTVAESKLDSIGSVLSLTMNSKIQRICRNNEGSFGLQQLRQLAITQRSDVLATADRYSHQACFFISSGFNG